MKKKATMMMQKKLKKTTMQKLRVKKRRVTCQQHKGMRTVKTMIWRRNVLSTLKNPLRNMSRQSVMTMMMVSHR